MSIIRLGITALGKVIIMVLVAMMALWLCLYVWVHGLGGYGYALMACVAALAVYVIVAQAVAIYHLYAGSAKALVHHRVAIRLFMLIQTIAIIIYMTMTPKNDRQWYDEMAHHIDYERHDNIIDVKNVRNFAWHDDGSYTIDWQNRRYDIDRLETMDFIVSIWDNENIAHTMISFGFSDGQYLTFSVETRKETHESFSSIAGFFRQYELIFIAADEKDIIYTRSNVRKEDVYIYPIIYDKAKMQALLLNYLHTGKSLNKQPRWYHTILSNCTTVIYELVQGIDNVPLDYRLLASGRLPQYLYEHGAIDNRYSIDEWRQWAYVNPKVSHYHDANPISSSQYSKIIRQNLPTTP